MSQYKVDRYKKEKANRKDIMKMKKLKSTLYKIGGVFACCLVIWWIGFSYYTDKQEKKEAEKNAVAAEINLDAIYDYQDLITAEE